MKMIRKAVKGACENIAKFVREIKFKSEVSKKNQDINFSLTTDKLFEDDPQLGSESIYIDWSSGISGKVSQVKFNRKLYWRKKMSQRKRGLR